MNLDELFMECPSSDLSSMKIEEYKNSLSNREIWIDTDICDDNFTMNIVRQIINWNREDMDLPEDKRRPIVLYLFCFGGDIDICNSIIDVIRASKTPVYSVNAGRSLSAAAYIFIACHKRFILPQSYFLFHEGSATISGSAEEIKKQTENYNEKIKELTSKMKKYTKYSDEEIERDIKQEWYVRANEAIEKGVADKIIESLDEIIF